MQFTMKFTAWIMAGILTMCAFAPAANACSLPYVDDVNEWGAKSSIATVVVCGKKPMQIKVVDTKTHKRVKATKTKRGVWLVVMKHNRNYKISVRDKGGKWKSIGYTVYPY